MELGPPIREYWLDQHTRVRDIKISVDFRSVAGTTGCKKVHVHGFRPLVLLSGEIRNIYSIIGSRPLHAP